MQMRNIHSVWINTRSKNKATGHYTVRIHDRVTCYTPCRTKNATVWYANDIHGPCIGTVYEKKMITRWHNTDRVLLKTRHVKHQKLTRWNTRTVYPRLKNRASLCIKDQNATRIKGTAVYNMIRSVYGLPEWHIPMTHAVCPRRAKYYMRRFV